MALVAGVLLQGKMPRSMDTVRVALCGAPGRHLARERPTVRSLFERDRAHRVYGQLLDLLA